MKRSTIFEIQSGELSNKRQRQTLPMDQIIQNPEFQKLTEKSRSRLIHWAVRTKNLELIKILAPNYSWPFQQISRAGKILHAGNFRAGKVLLEMLEKWNFFR